MLIAAMSEPMTDTTTAQVAADTDAALARSAAAGDTCAFESLYRRHAGRVHGVIMRLVGGQGVRAFGKPEASVVYDVKYVLPRNAVDGRL